MNLFIKTVLAVNLGFQHMSLLENQMHHSKDRNILVYGVFIQGVLHRSKRQVSYRVVHGFFLSRV
jgi:hypothetical protein